MNMTSSSLQFEVAYRVLSGNDTRWRSASSLNERTLEGRLKMQDWN